MTKVSLFKFWPISFIKLELWIEGFDKTLGTNENWGKWSDIVAVMLPEWKRVFQWQVILVRCKIYGIKELEASELLHLGGLEKKYSTKPCTFTYGVAIYKAGKRCGVARWMGDIKLSRAS